MSTRSSVSPFVVLGNGMAFGVQTYHFPFVAVPQAVCSLALAFAGEGSGLVSCGRGEGGDGVDGLGLMGTGDSVVWSV